MRRRWKLFGGAGLAGICIAAGILAHSRAVIGETTSTSTTSSDEAARDPFAPYPTPGAIRYEELSAADKAAVDHIHEVTDTSQLAASHEAYASATAWASADADRQIAERGVGLEGTAEDGVVP
jgi:hypothetical protein